MADDLNLIRRFMAALVARERTLIAVTALLRLVALVALVLLCSVFTVSQGWGRSSALMLLVGVGGVGVWAWVWMPLLLGWRPAGDGLRHARLVEAIDPQLRGRLVTSVAYVDGPTAGESQALVALVARRAAKRVTKVSPSMVLPSGRTVRAAFLAFLAWLVLLPALFLAPGGAGGVLRWWAAGFEAQAAVATSQVQVEEALARVGDLQLRYTYPPYTGLEPRQVENTTGDVHAPPGTLVEVLLRTGEPAEAAGLVAYEEAFDAEMSEDGRTLAGRFTIQNGVGTWRTVLYRNGEPQRSRDFEILPQEDLPPDVMLDAGSEFLEVGLDQPFELDWRARDDYGIRLVELSVGDTRNTLWDDGKRRAEVMDRVVFTPADLGLRVGETVDLVVEAWDNDTIGGSKMGRSQVVRLHVLGAQGRRDRRDARQQELEDLMVPVLADFLTEPWPPGRGAEAMLDYGEDLADRYRPIQEAAERLWDGMTRDSLDRNHVEKVIITGRDLIRYTQVAFSEAKNARAPQAEVEVTGDLREKAVVALENALLAILRYQQIEALSKVWEQAEVLDQSAENLAEMLDQDDIDPQEILSMLDTLERQLAKLMTLVENLESGGLKEFINSREGEIKGIMEEIRQAMADGRVDDAKRLMERLQQQLEQLSGGIVDDLEQRKAQQQESGQAGDDLVKELKDLEKEQRELQRDVQALREQQDNSSAEEVAAAWTKIEALAQQVADGGGDYGDRLEQAKRPFYERERVAAAVESSESLLDAVRARDLRGAMGATQEASHQWIVTQTTAYQLRERGGTWRGPGPEVPRALESKVQEIDRLLRQLESQNSQMDSKARQQAQDLEARQKDLQNRLQQAQEQAEEVAKDLPVNPEGMGEMLDEASERMGQAGEDLKSGKAMAAEGSQSVAQERIRRARKALEQAMQQAGGGGGGLQSPQERREQGEQDGGEDGQRNDSGGRDMRSEMEIELPGHDAYATPEAYRKALVEGMQGEVPDEYRAWKKRYYEELVAQ